MSWLKSRRLQFTVGVLLLFLALFVALRGVFYLGFSEVGESVQATPAVILKTLWIGVRFDLRLAILISVPVALLAYLPRYNLIYRPWLRRLIDAYLGLVLILVLLTYAVDLGHYAYLGQRLNSTVLRFFDDAAISARMVWESYPVIWIALGLAATVSGASWMIRRIERRTLDRPDPHLTYRQRIVGATLLTVLMVGGIMGRFSLVPLRWNHAFFSGDSAVGALGINPVLFFYDTFQNRERDYDIELVRSLYPQVAAYLGVTDPDPTRLDYTRQFDRSEQAAVEVGQRPPNIVFVMLESLGASRLGAFGNPLQPTPVLDRMARDGWFMPTFFVPVSGTARTVFASVSGIPDVSTYKTASRNPLISHQRSIVNELQGYEKLYFLGGSAGWANIGGFLNLSIDGLRLFQEGGYTEPVVDVWGISDYGLFKEADRVLRTLPPERPFFAVLQTAANHRPFTIPEDATSAGFKVDPLSDEEVRRHGFDSAAQYNATRLLDFNIGRLLDIAKASGWLDNTIFMLYGDHNDRTTLTPHMAPIYADPSFEGLHVPGIIYAPKLIGPRRIEDAASLVDLLPTAAELAGLPYRNTTFGRALTRAAPEGERAVFIQSHDKRAPLIGMVTRDFVVHVQHDGSDARLHDMHHGTVKEDISAQHPELTRKLAQLALGIYQTAQYMFYHNRDEAPAEPQSIP